MKRLARSGFGKWEAADVAGARLARECGASDVSADWTLYAHNGAAAATLASLGAKYAVASPECDPADASRLAARAARPRFAFLAAQSTPLFISLTRPAADDPSLLEAQDGKTYKSFFADGLWITVRSTPNSFSTPAGAPVRVDISWDP